MRELTLAELELVAGGTRTEDGATELDEIIVVGDRGDRGDFGDWGDFGDRGDWGDYIDGGGGGEPVDLRPDYNACEDREADTLADQINEEIKQQPDSDRREYGALIYRDADGNLQRTALISGDNRSVTGLIGKTAADFGMTSWAQLVGVVHSHPTLVNVSQAATEAEREANPVWVSATPESHFERPSSDDWANLFDFVRDGANLDNLTAYISHAGIVGEFDAYDNQDESRKRGERVAGHGVESGDYNPGTVCQ